jgi:hypothetical protein
MSPRGTDRKPCMLLNFRAENVRSFRDEFSFSLVATAMADKEVARTVSWREGGRPLDVLPVLGAFGANASGKSNLLRAMNDMRNLVLYSFRAGSPVGSLGRHPFALDPEARARPSHFEIDLIFEGIRHLYGFAVGDDEVIEEWAYRFPQGRAALIFRRHGLEVELGAKDRVKGRGVSELLRPNALFLSTAASANHPTLLPLYSWFSRNLLLARADTRRSRQALTSEMLDDPHRREQVLALLRAADLGVIDAERQELEPVIRERLRRVVRVLRGEEGDAEALDDGPEFDQFGIRLVHDAGGANVALDADDESLGTMVWFGLIGPVIDALARGCVFLADELDASLHPSLVRQLVLLFQDPKTNPRRAQLIFNSHDVTVLGDSGSRQLGRDQIWFTDKLSDGSTRVFPLTEMDPRKEEAVGRRYLSGRYGAVPILSDQEFGAAATLITADQP